MEFRNGYKIERFNTNFNTNGWASLYIGAMVINLLATFMNIPFSYLLVGSSMYGVVSVLLFTVKTFAMFFLIIAAYSKAILIFINTLSLDGKKFKSDLAYSSLFFVIFANILLSIITIGIYIPWGYKAIIDKIVKNIEYEGKKCFKFTSLASKLFSFIVISIVTLSIVTFALVLSIVVMYKYGDLVALMFLPFIIFPILIVLFFSFIAVICAIQVFTIDWAINLKMDSEVKNATYTLNINASSAILFYLGQTLLLVITFGFYIGAYMMNIYNYFVSRIVEKTDGKITGNLRFIKPTDRGASFLLSQVIMSMMAFGFYSPFALVEYSKFFVNNTYLETIETNKEDEIIVINP